MERIRELAFAWAARESGLAVLGVIGVMFTLAGDPVLALKAGAIGFTLVAALLMFRADRAPLREPEGTEVWSGLKREERPPRAVARRLIGRANREAASTFGWYSAGTAVALWITEIGVTLSGF
ncbi:hypothetical protein [Phreatobacter stygius]|uniref:Uncharacterized protein n=1 Tax=Phreatobacter stygius TaxID=1940610 RepID=A0A4D7B5Z3_9HYPH|nr:hypothetical protein [Phreatobacter stygius]QCI65808.1 hypothetical protein E8M01_17270 [Phreatobacter stygius]